MKRQQQNGNAPSGLIGPERGILKTYILYAATRDEEDT